MTLRFAKHYSCKVALIGNPMILSFQWIRLPAGIYIPGAIIWSSSMAICRFVIFQTHCYNFKQLMAEMLSNARNVCVLNEAEPR